MPSLLRSDLCVHEDNRSAHYSRPPLGDGGVIPLEAGNAVARSITSFRLFSVLIITLKLLRASIPTVHMQRLHYRDLLPEQQER